MKYSGGDWKDLCVTQTWETVVNPGLASLHLSVYFRMDRFFFYSEMGGSGSIQGDYSWLFVAIFHFFLKPRLNSQFVPLNNSGRFIYFEFSSHCSSRSWSPPILARLVALKMHPHHPYMYKGSSRDCLCYASALALLRVFAVRCEENA